MFTFGLARYAAFTLISLSIVTLAVLGGGYLAYPDGYPDPFALYTDLVPGTIAIGLERSSCYDRSYGYPRVYATDTVCQLDLKSEFFSDVRLTVEDYSKVIEVIFIGDNLRVADIVVHWGQPRMIEKGTFRTVLWWAEGVTALIADRSMNLYWQPVRFVRFGL